jgi:uncharacterized protein YjiS (DUF1127 family)
MGAIMADSLAQHLARDWASPRLRGSLAGLVQLPLIWVLRARRRKELLNLDAQQMRDCGLDPVEVHREATKPFWRD